jgi:riboflavin synthase
MFTGIIEAVGRIRSVRAADDAARIAIDAGSLALDDVKRGDSIACNGVCLTVVAMGAGQLEFDVSRETLSCTVDFTEGSAVNLEKALRLADRLGGHLVSAHVDGVGTVRRFEAVGADRLLAIDVAADLARYIARKGSIAVNGVSLTVNTIAGTRFETNLIPQTLQNTNLHALTSGAGVNIEVDMVARYCERLLAMS